jgi:cyclic pyranopterin phosphate synthase
MTGRVFSINISESKGGPKKMVRSAFLKEAIGIEGDAHAGPGLRQVSLLSVEEIEKAEEGRPSGTIELHPGVFAENITTQDVDLSRVKVGDRLMVGEDAILRISQIGKDCPSPCSIGRSLGECIMPKQGIFATVEKSGEVKVHDRIRLAARASRPGLRHPFLKWQTT